MMIVRTTIKKIPAVLAKFPSTVGKGGSFLNISSGISFIPSLSSRQIALRFFFYNPAVSDDLVFHRVHQ